MERPRHSPFGRLAGLWKHFGNYFTVTDSCFYKVTWKRRFNYMLPFYIIVVFFISTLLTDWNKDNEILIFVGYTFLLILENISIVIYDMIRIKQKFMSNPAAINRRLTKFDNTFKEKPWCITIIPRSRPLIGWLILQMLSLWICLASL